MEHKTSQGGETTLVFDDNEISVLKQIAQRYGTTIVHLADTVGRLRQANPLESFSELVNRLPGILPAQPKTRGVAPAHVARAQRSDPLADLEADIRQRLSKSSSLGATSQMQQTDAILLQALATCLQTRALCERLDVIAHPLVVAEEDKP